MAEINWHEVEMHHFNFGHGRGLIRIVHVPTGISVEADNSRGSIIDVEKLKQELMKKVLGEK
jgi:hypothetical protein